MMMTFESQTVQTSTLSLYIVIEKKNCKLKFYFVPECSFSNYL